MLRRQSLTFWLEPDRFLPLSIVNKRCYVLMTKIHLSFDENTFELTVVVGSISELHEDVRVRESI